MKITFRGISFWKYVDLAIQVLAFLVLLVLCGFFDWGPFAFFVEAAVQLISCLAWCLYFENGAPGHRGGIFIRRTFLVTAFIWFFASMCSNAGAAALLCLIMFLGPIMGLIYFIITLLEATYYSKARKPFYLL